MLQLLLISSFFVYPGEETDSVFSTPPQQLLVGSNKISPKSLLFCRLNKPSLPNLFLFVC